MNKKWSLTVFGVAALALSVAASGFSIFRDVTPKEASAASSEGSYEIIPTINPATGTADSSEAFTTNTILDKVTYNANSHSYTYSLTGKENIASVSSTANTYPGRKSSWKVGKTKGDGTVNFTVVGDEALKITSVVVSAYVTNSSKSSYVNIGESEVGKQAVSSTDATDFTFTYPSDSALRTVSLTGGIGATSNNIPIYVTKIVVNYSIVDAALTSITASLKNDSTVWYEDQEVTVDDIDVVANFSDGSTQTISTGIELTNSVLKAGANEITVTAAGMTTTLSVTAEARTVTSVSVVGDMIRKAYLPGDAWDLSGLSLDVAYNYGEGKNISFDTEGVDYLLDYEVATDGVTSLYLYGTYGGVEFEKTITGISVGYTFEKLLSEVSIYDGMQFYMVGIKDGEMNQVAGPISSDYLSSVDYPTLGIEGVGAQLFTFKGTVGAWEIYCGENELLCTALKKLKLKSSESDGNSYWTVSIADGDATIQNNISTYGRFLFNFGSSRFTTYTSAANATMLLPQIYAKAPANDIYAFIRDNMRMGDPALGGSGSGACSTEGYYAAAKAALAELSSEDRAAFEADADGLYTAALARYNAWAIANGDLTPFDGKATITSAANAFAVKENNPSIWAVVAIASVGVVAGTSLIVLRKKKEN